MPVCDCVHTDSFSQRCENRWLSTWNRALSIWNGGLSTFTPRTAHATASAGTPVSKGVLHVQDRRGANAHMLIPDMKGACFGQHLRRIPDRPSDGAGGKAVGF